MEIVPPTIEPQIPAESMNLEQFRPMLSASLPCAKRQVPTFDQIYADLKRMDWSRGFLVSPKYDGIRAIKHPEHGLVTRTLTPVRNQFVQESLSSNLFDYLDGELIKGTPEEMVNFNDTQSAIMSQAGSSFFTYCVFDDIQKPNIRFNWRASQVHLRVEELLKGVNFQGMFQIVAAPQYEVRTIDELLQVEEDIVSQGYEGIIIRDPWGAYKNNRSTFKQQGMIKLKRFLDAEAAVIGFEELMRNANEPLLNKLGYTKRSAHQENQIPGNTLGKLVVRGINGRYKNCEFKIGSGFDAATRDAIWNNRSGYLGGIVKYKYQDAGSKDAPRIPTFLGFRPHEDMT